MPPALNTSKQPIRHWKRQRSIMGDQLAAKIFPIRFFDGRRSVLPAEGQVGVDWNMMWWILGHQKKANAAIWPNGRQTHLMCWRYRHNDFYRYQYNYILYLFNQAKIKVVKSAFELLNEQISIAFQLFYLKRLHWEDVLALLPVKEK